MNTSGETDTQIAVRVPRVVPVDVHTVRIGIAHVDEVAVRRASISLYNSAVANALRF